jgi:uncharacterized protein
MEASSEAVELVRRGFAAYNAGDMETLMELVHPELELRSDPDTMNAGDYRGREGLNEWNANWVEAWESFQVEPTAVEAVDDRRVLVEARQHARGAGSGVEVEMDVYWAFEVEEGHVRRIELHIDRADAVAAVERWRRARPAAA